MTTPLTADKLKILARYLTVGETYFFREPNSLVALETQILPEIIQARRGHSHYLRIWSAGCSTGEEPYSIAILLHKLLTFGASFEGEFNT